MSGPYVPGSTQPTDITCQNCGQASAPGMRFCNRCGNPLAAIPPSAPSVAPGAYSSQPPHQAQPYYPPSPSHPPYGPPEQPSYHPQQAAYGPPPAAAQAQYPQYSQPVARASARSPKSVGLGFILALLFGPLGLFYATAGGGIVMLLVSAGAWTLFYTRVVGGMDYYDPGFTSSGISWLTLLPFGIWLGFILVCVVWAIVAINSHNNKLRAPLVY
jgi:hypothetical protein